MIHFTEMILFWGSDVVSFLDSFVPALLGAKGYTPRMEMIQPVPMVLRLEEWCVVGLATVIILYFTGSKLLNDIKSWTAKKENIEVQPEA